MNLVVIKDKLRDIERTIEAYDNGLGVFPDPNNAAEGTLDKVYEQLLSLGALVRKLWEDEMVGWAPPKDHSGMPLRCAFLPVADSEASEDGGSGG